MSPRTAVAPRRRAGGSIREEPVAMREPHLPQRVRAGPRSSGRSYRRKAEPACGRQARAGPPERRVTEALVWSHRRPLCALASRPVGLGATARRAVARRSPERGDCELRPPPRAFSRAGRLLYAFSRRVGSGGSAGCPRSKARAERAQRRIETRDLIQPRDLGLGEGRRPRWLPRRELAPTPRAGCPAVPGCGVGRLTHGATFALLA